MKDLKNFSYPKEVSENEVTHTYINKLSHHVDPMVFPIMFPWGDIGWSIVYYKKPKDNVEKISKTDILDTLNSKINKKPKGNVEKISKFEIINTSKSKVNENLTALQYW